jgi:soluble lytic murein transglycosylase
MSSKLFLTLVCTISAICSLTVGCDAQRPVNDPLASLRELTKDGKMPAESVVADIERRFAGQQAGVLAKLLRARIKVENKDFTGAAALLDSGDFAQKTKLADYALWLRGRALQESGDHANAKAVFARLIAESPDSLRRTDAKLLWSQSAIQSGEAAKVPEFLADLIDARHAKALIMAAKAYGSIGDQPNATMFYRRTYFYGAGSNEAKEAELRLISLAQPLTPSNAEEITARADKLFAAKNFVEAEKSFALLASGYPASLTAEINLMRLVTFANVKKMSDAQSAFIAIPTNSAVKEQAHYELVTGFAKNRLWPDARRTAEEMRQKFPAGKLTPKAWVDAGYAARDAKNKGEENYFLRTALIHFPKAVEVAGAQFELAWLEHESKNYAKASEMLIEHLAVYAAKDTTNRGKAGYWSARNSELAGKTVEACVLYDATAYRYGSNWYGHLSLQRMGALKCKSDGLSRSTPEGVTLATAAANLKTITVAPETSGPRELERAEKSEQLSTIGLFDWAIDELQEAKKTAQNSPKINLALAKHYRLKSDNVNALLALAKSYPDYAQMFPEEMGRDEWDIFYPHMAWDQISAWARHRNLDIYQVAGLIRQESVFNPTAASPAKAYGLMQLLVPTAQMMARKHGVTARIAAGSDLYQPALNIELGTAYMREQLDKYGRVEYMAVAYNAGPGRVVTWRKTLPLEMDEFVEAIPFRETKGYVQGIIRNTAQYRRLYDENGNFRPNVGTKPVRSAIDTMSNEQLAVEFPEIVIDDNGTD